MKKYIAAIFMLLVIFSVCSAEVTITGDMTRIDDGFHRGDTETENVVLTNNIESIGEHAFSDCINLSEIYIPDSVTYISPNAFENDPKLTFLCSLSSYAYKYAIDKNIPVTVTGTYWISGITVQGDIVVINVTTDESCDLSVTVWNEDYSAVLETRKTSVKKNMTSQDVYVILKDLPDHFIIHACLVDPWDNHIAEPYETLKYTAAYQEFESRTPQDFTGRRIIDYGEDGFGVLSDSVRIVKGRVIGNVGFISTDFPIYPGEKLFFEGQHFFCKAKTSEKNVFGQWVVTPDEDVSVSDFYDFLRVRTSAQLLDASGKLLPQTAQETDGVSIGLHGTSYQTSVSFEKSESVGPGQVSINGTVTLVGECNYDRLLFGSDYLDFRFYVDAQGTASYDISGEGKGNKTIKLVNPKNFIGGPFEVDLHLDLPVEYQGEGTGYVTTGFNTRVGFQYDVNAKAFSVIRSGKFYPPELSADGTAYLKTGPKISVEFTAAHILNGYLGTWLGGEFTVGTSHLEERLASGTGLRHDCSLCFDVEAGLFMDLEARLGVRLWSKEYTTLFDRTIPVYRHQFFSGYLSVLNGTNSVYHGKPSFGSGNCQNVVSP